MRQIATSSNRLADRIRVSFRAIPSIKSISSVNDALKYLVLATVCSTFGLIRGANWLDSFSPSISLVPSPFSFSASALHLASSSRLHVVSLKFEAIVQLKRTHDKANVNERRRTRCAPFGDASSEMFIKRRRDVFENDGFKKSTKHAFTFTKTLRWWKDREI